MFWHWDKVVCFQLNPKAGLMIFLIFESIEFWRVKTALYKTRTVIYYHDNSWKSEEGSSAFLWWSWYIYILFTIDFAIKYENSHKDSHIHIPVCQECHWKDTYRDENYKMKRSGFVTLRTCGTIFDKFFFTVEGHFLMCFHSMKMVVVSFSLKIQLSPLFEEHLLY